MKRFLPLLVCAVTLSGCSTMSDLRNSPPSEQYSSSKDVSSLSECILFGWQENSNRYGDVFLQPFSGGKTVLSQGSQEFADVTSSGKGSSVLFYHQSGLFKYRIDAREEAIKKCI